jgi:ATP-binding cassette subfamily A (ABC1) protein 3
VGRPSIILLDEPSAGMDPEARRFMWKVVAKIASNKTSAVILTTHSMDEAEALSTKMGIMVKGGIFKCFGSAQRIRNKFAQGYIVEIKIAQPSRDQLSQVISESMGL